MREDGTPDETMLELVRKSARRGKGEEWECTRWERDLYCRWNRMSKAKKGPHSRGTARPRECERAMTETGCGEKKDLKKDWGRKKGWEGGEQEDA